MINSVLAARRTIGGPLAVGGGGAADWFRAGGAPAPAVAHTFKGASSQAAGYVNLVNPGTDGLFAGVEPTWNATDGLIFNGTTQYLRSIIPVSTRDKVMLVRFTNGPTTGNLILAGCSGTGSTSFYLQVGVAGTIRYANGGSAGVAPNMTAGVMAVADNRGYRNGVVEGGATGTWSGSAVEIYLGAWNNNGTPALFCPVRIQAFAVWNTSTNHATWLPAVSAAVALL